MGVASPCLIRFYSYANPYVIHERTACTYGCVSLVSPKRVAPGHMVAAVGCLLSDGQIAMWREELLVRLDVDPHDFPIVVIGNKVRVLYLFGEEASVFEEEQGR